jgi:3-methyladenine DNA glycosylase/8-oxoguanine DNA glycosylase
VIERWTQVLGVGRWTVQMLLISQFGRPDIFTAHDLGLRRSMEQHLGLAVDGPLSSYEKKGPVMEPF